MTNPATNPSDLIVCATDFSEAAKSAFEWAAGFARREGARISLLHVLPDPTRSREDLAADGAVFEAAQLDDARARLGAEAASTFRATGVTVEPEILRGRPEVCILEHARLRAARAIVVGVSEQLLLERWVLGSVAERIVRSAACPVVVVPPRDRGRPWFPAANGEAAPLKALVGLEAPDGSAPLVELAAQLRRRGRCDVTFLHLYWPTEEFTRLGLRGARNPVAVDPDVVKNLEPPLLSLVGGLPGQGAVELDILPALGAPAANLALAAENRAFDLLVVGSHQRHGLARILKGSVAQTLAHQATRVPVICVPLPAVTDAAGATPRLPRVLTVLAATDLSDVGNASVPYAYAMLRANGGVVELVHVHERALPSPPYAFELPEGLTEEKRAGIEGALRALVPADAESLGITTHITIIDGGRPAETIVAAAERLNVDAINLGSHGRGAVARAVLGSVAEAVVRNARRPVLVVPARA
jgi:nucleotide-binding universal stress UspA family protein